MRRSESIFSLRFKDRRGTFLVAEVIVLGAKGIWVKQSTYVQAFLEYP